MRERHPFVDALYGLSQRGDRAALAELRKSFIRPMAALPWVAPFLARDAPPWDEAAFVLVAGLYAINPRAGNRTLAERLRTLSDTSDSVALRFRALLDADPQELGNHLRHAVSLVGSKELSVDYDDLLRAVRAWGREDKRAQRAWARDFWGAARPADDNDSDRDHEVNPS